MSMPNCSCGNRNGGRWSMSSCGQTRHIDILCNFSSSTCKRETVEKATYVQILALVTALEEPTHPWKANLLTRNKKEKEKAKLLTDGSACAKHLFLWRYYHMTEHGQCCKVSCSPGHPKGIKEIPSLCHGTWLVHLVSAHRVRCGHDRVKITQALPNCRRFVTS